MAKRTFKSDLSVSGIEQLKKDLLNYKNNILQRKLELLTQKLAEQGVDIAKANVSKLDAIFTGELFNSISAKPEKARKQTAVCCVVADSKHACFVEFGTGQLGMEAPYPHPLPEGLEWNYNTGKTIFEIAPGEYGWFYPRDGKWYFTQGMPARPFMFETSMELAQLVDKTVREVFRQ
ncbi:MAG: hypothetical protein J6Q48_10565 [Bacteroidaceae bacterium]|nr:hypothetical protein [Bacteroidaceae bacterium]